jgi:mitogen-activated protein kinase 1/3
MENSKPQVCAEFMDWKVGENYVVNKFIAEGTYGEVVEAIQISPFRLVAIKRIKHIFSYKSILHAKRILRELILLKRLKHPYVIDLLDIIEPEDRYNFDEIYLVMELADMDLKSVIKSPIKLNNEEVRTLGYKLLCCLNYLHSAKIIHRDIKPQNILVSNMKNEQTREKKPVGEW